MRYHWLQTDSRCGRDISHFLRVKLCILLPVSTYDSPCTMCIPMHYNYYNPYSDLARPSHSLLLHTDFNRYNTEKMAWIEKFSRKRALIHYYTEKLLCSWEANTCTIMWINEVILLSLSPPPHVNINFFGFLKLISELHNSLWIENGGVRCSYLHT